MEIAPLWNRLLLFWSDDRSPHEVLSACKDRISDDLGFQFCRIFQRWAGAGSGLRIPGFAATVWYYDEKNPSIPLYASCLFLQ